MSAVLVDRGVPGAGAVVELHEAEDEVARHELELVGRRRDDVALRRRVNHRVIDVAEPGGGGVGGCGGKVA